MRLWRADRVERLSFQPADVSNLVALTKAMEASVPLERAELPSMPHLLAHGAWNTVKLFFLVVAGLVALFAILLWIGSKF